MRFCDVDSDCGAPGALCIGTLNDGTGRPIPGVRLCTAGCNLVSGAGCAPGLGCRAAQETGGARRYYTDCGPADFGTQFDFCVDSSDCDSGYTCSAFDECLQWCRTWTDCPGSLDCYPTGVTIGSVSYGVCDV
jgi:hypothetical protein